MNDAKHEEEEKYGSLLLLPPIATDEIDTESEFMKGLIQISNWITLPLLFLFYGKNERPVKTYNFLHKVYIAFIISCIPIILGLLYKYKNTSLSRYTISISIWVTMFSIIVLIYAL